MEYPRRLDEDGEYCDDPDCEDCEESWEDWDDDEWVDAQREPSVQHPSLIGATTWDSDHAARMHPAARACPAHPVQVGLLPRLFAEFVSIVIWWAVVVVGFALAAVLYDSPPAMLLVGLTLVPLLGETVLTAELGVTPGKFLTGLRVRSGDSNPGLSRAIIRTFVIVVPFLPMYVQGPTADISFMVGALWIVVLMISVAVDPQHRGFHDRLAGTTVVTRASLGT